METPTDRPTPMRGWARMFGTGAAALLAVGMVATSAGAATTSKAPRGGSGASGNVAALSATSMEVQNASSGQTTVSWTATTQFSKTVTESVSSVAVGDCVTATGTASKKSKTTIAARSITVSTPSSSGACGAGAGAFTRTGAGGAPGGAPGGGPAGGGFGFRTGSAGANSGTRPSFRAGGAAGGNFRTQLANIDIASGKVTAVDGSTLSITGISISPGSFAGRQKPTGKSTSKPKTPPKPKTEKLKVTTTSSTPVSTTQTVASDALAVGDCVAAFGPAASNGSVTATTVHITSTGGGTCTVTRLGGPGGGGFFGGASGGSGA